MNMNIVIIAATVTTTKKITHKHYIQSFKRTTNCIQTDKNYNKYGISTVRIAVNRFTYLLFCNEFPFIANI